MNLITDKWMKVITKKNKVEEISIFDFFNNIEEYIELSGVWYHRVVIYNFLFAISQSALKGIIVDEESQVKLFKKEYIKYVLEYLGREDIKKAFVFFSKNFFYNFDILDKKKNEHNWKKISIDKNLF